MPTLICLAEAAGADYNEGSSCRSAARSCVWTGCVVEDVNALDSSVLVLNRFFMAIHVIPARRAFSLLCKEAAEVVHVVDDRYDSFNFESWREVSQYRELFPESDDRWLLHIVVSDTAQ